MVKKVGDGTRGLLFSTRSFMFSNEAIVPKVQKGKSPFLPTFECKENLKCQILPSLLSC